MSYPGGKGGAGVYQQIINLMPPHTKYVEPFLGMGAIMRRKKPAFQSFGVDSDIFVIGEWANHSIPGLIVECCDGIRYLKKEAEVSRHTLVYCDPPYLRSTRSSKGALYRHQMTDEEHVQLLGVLVHLPCMVMISGYDNPLYASMLGKWNREDFQAVTRGGSMRTESVWFNFPKPVALHDYRYVGNDFREREKFKRRHNTWKRKLARMTEQEKMAMFAAIEDVRA